MAQEDSWACLPKDSIQEYSLCKWNTMSLHPAWFRDWKEGKKIMCFTLVQFLPRTSQPIRRFLFSLIENIFKDDTLLRTQRNMLQITSKSKWEAIHSRRWLSIAVPTKDDLCGLLLSASVTSQKSLHIVLHKGCSQFCRHRYWAFQLHNVLSLFWAHQTSQNAIHLCVKYLLNTYYVPPCGNVKMHEAQSLPLKIFVSLKFIDHLLHIRFHGLNCAASKFVFGSPNVYSDYIQRQGL